MTKETAKAIGAEVEAALRAVAERNGMTLVFRGGTFDSVGYKPRVEFREADADARSFAAYATLVGLKPEDIGRLFDYRGRTYAIVGVKLGRSFKVVARHERKEYLFTPAAVAAALGK